MPVEDLWLRPIHHLHHITVIRIIICYGNTPAQRRFKQMTMALKRNCYSDEQS